MPLCLPWSAKALLRRRRYDMLEPAIKPTRHRANDTGVRDGGESRIELLHFGDRGLRTARSGCPLNLRLLDPWVFIWVITLRPQNQADSYSSRVHSLARRTTTLHKVAEKTAHPPGSPLCRCWHTCP
jgi:hypothetical protein